MNVRAGRASRRGGDLILTAGHLLRSEGNGDGSVGVCGSVVMRAGSVESDSARGHGEKGLPAVGGDVDLAPGAGSMEPPGGMKAGGTRNAHSAHGQIVLRDHTLTPRLIINSRYILP